MTPRPSARVLLMPCATRSTRRPRGVAPARRKRPTEKRSRRAPRRRRARQRGRRGGQRRRRRRRLIVCLFTLGGAFSGRAGKTRSDLSGLQPQAAGMRMDRASDHDDADDLIEKRRQIFRSALAAPEAPTGAATSCCPRHSRKLCSDVWSVRATERTDFVGVLRYLEPEAPIHETNATVVPAIWPCIAVEDFLRVPNKRGLGRFFRAFGVLQLLFRLRRVGLRGRPPYLTRAFHGGAPSQLRRLQLHAKVPSAASLASRRFSRRRRGPPWAAFLVRRVVGEGQSS